MVAPSSKPLDRILGPLVDCLDPASAERLLRFQLDHETQARIDDLAGKANRGELSDEERAEYALFVEAIDLVGLLQAKARRITTHQKTST